MITGVVDWRHGHWAHNCDFKNKDLTRVYAKGKMCDIHCKNTKGCTHWSYSTYKSGTCWLKYGTVSKSNAFSTKGKPMSGSCGVPSKK